MDPKPHHSESTSQESANGAGSNGQDADQHQSDEPLSDSDFESKVSRLRTLLSLRQETATVREAEARATTGEEEAKHAGKTGPRQMFLESLERIAGALLPAVVALAAIGFSIAALAIDPWLFSINLLLAPIGVLTYLRARGRSEPPGSNSQGNDEGGDE